MIARILARTADNESYLLSLMLALPLAVSQCVRVRDTRMLHASLPLCNRAFCVHIQDPAGAWVQALQAKEELTSEGLLRGRAVP